MHSSIAMDAVEVGNLFRVLFEHFALAMEAPGVNG